MAIELNPDSGVAHINLGHLLETTSHRQAAIEELKTGIELEPKNADGHNMYGVLLAGEGKLDEAIGQLQTAVDQAPRSAEYRLDFGRALSAKGRYAEALPQLETAANLSDHDDPAILQVLASVYAERGDYQKANATAKQALELAVHRRKDELAAALKGDIAGYENQLPQGTNPGGRKQP
jgi:tetratricopeptide (TPR) repeat protein